MAVASASLTDLPAEKADKDAAAPHGAPGSGQIILRDYVLPTADPVPAFSGPAATALRASDRRRPAVPFVALIGAGDVVPRVDAMQALRGLAKPGLLELSAFGPLPWQDGRERLG